VPFYNSVPDFQHQVGTLAVGLIDHPNTDFLRAVGAPKGQGSLKRLAGWIAETGGMSDDDAKARLGGLFAVQSLRSKMAVHRAGADADAALERAGVALDDLPEGFARLVQRATDSVRSLAEHIRETA